MINIKELLDKFKNFTNDKLIFQTAVMEILRNDFSIEVPKESIQLKNKTLYLKMSGGAKTEIITRQSELIQKINRHVTIPFITLIPLSRI